MRPGAGKLVPVKIRSKEHIPGASDTSGWEIAADAVVVQVAADLQQTGACTVPNSPEQTEQVREQVTDQVERLMSALGSETKGMASLLFHIELSELSVMLFAE